MPWSGGSFTRTNGVHTGSTLWVQDRDAGTKILATRHDTHDQDLADGINSTLEKSGSNAATGDLDIGSNRITLTADGTATQDVATINQLQNNAPAFQATDTGTANAYVIALSPAVTAYAAGQAFTFKAANASTTASTLNVNTIGTKAIKKLNDQDIASGDIESGSIVSVVYDGTSFQMTSQLASSATSTPGGSNTQVQYNSSGAFAGSANLTFDASTLTVTGTSSLDGAVTVNDTGAAVDFRVETNNHPLFMVIDGTLDRWAHGIAPSVAFGWHYQPDALAAWEGSNLSMVEMDFGNSQTFKASESVTNAIGLNLQVPAWVLNGGSVTNTATLRVAGADTVGTNNYSLLVDAGLARFDGGVTFGDETLDTYDEGTWTPTLVGASTAGSHTYGTQDGRYTRIGRMVSCIFNVHVSTFDTWAGAVSIGGLPFTTDNVASTGAGTIGSFRLIGLGSLTSPTLTLLNSQNGTTSSFKTVGDDASNAANVDAAEFDNGALIYGSIVFQVA